MLNSPPGTWFNESFDGKNQSFHPSKNGRCFLQDNAFVEVIIIVYARGSCVAGMLITILTSNETAGNLHKALSRIL